MKTKYKNILLQGWMFDCLDLMDKEEQDKYFATLLRSAIEGKVLTDNDKWTYLIEKALSSIEETREAYYQKATKIGMKGKDYGIQGKDYGVQGKEYGIQGKEYGIQGKEFGIQGKEYGVKGGEFGKLGGRPRKGETKEQYAERKKKENAEWEKQQELYKMITAEQGLYTFIKTIPQNQLQELASAYISKGYTKPQISKVFEYIRGKKCV